MKKCGIQCWAIVFVAFFIFMMITFSGCAHHSYPSEIYLGEYIASRMEYNANNNKESLVEANKNWDLYMKARISE
jgi:hypothetical protein|tara:strand:- start:229 stop:453 length:225 start_codon:yes stop_codon:yes gene_type:complete